MSATTGAKIKSTPAERKRNEKWSAGAISRLEGQVRKRSHTK